MFLIIVLFLWYKYELRDYLRITSQPIKWMYLSITLTSRQLRKLVIKFLHSLDFKACRNVLTHWTNLVGFVKWAYDRPSTVKSLAAPSKLKPSLHGIGSGRYLLHITEAGTRVSPVRIQIGASPLYLTNSLLAICSPIHIHLKPQHAWF